MNPFYFGPAERPLFGIYSHGKRGARSARSVLLCYPIGSEYMRAHRAFRQFHSLLGRAGLNVLRFDYSGTGDSAGAGVDASATTWVEDIGWAIDELRDNAAAERVSVVGLRWGATLAAAAAADRDDVEELILWDPVLLGTTFLDRAVGSPRPAQVVGVEGFPFSPTLVAELESFDLAEIVATGVASSVTALVAEDRQEYETLRLALSDRGRGEELALEPSPGSWEQADPFGDALIPQRIIQRMVERLTGEAPS